MNINTQAASTKGVKQVIVGVELRCNQTFVKLTEERFSKLLRGVNKRCACYIIHATGYGNA